MLLRKNGRNVYDVVRIYNIKLIVITKILFRKLTAITDF